MRLGSRDATMCFDKLQEFWGFGNTPKPPVLGLKSQRQQTPIWGFVVSLTGFNIVFGFCGVFMKQKMESLTRLWFDSLTGCDCLQLHVKCVFASFIHTVHLSALWAGRKKRLWCFHSAFKINSFWKPVCLKLWEYYFVKAVFQHANILILQLSIVIGVSKYYKVSLENA